MRSSLILGGFLLTAGPILSAPPSPASAGSLLPPTIPGYELRTLDARKPVLFKVNGTWVQAALPIFFYFPTQLPPPAVPLLRKAYGELLELGNKPEWTAAELQAVIADLDAALRLLEQPAPAPGAPPRS